MADYVCIIQEGQPADERREELAAGLREIGVAAFGDDPAAQRVSWNVVKRGFGFTAGEPSTSSIIIRSVPPGLRDDRREAFMRKVCDLWERVTGCTTNEVVVTAWDGPLPGSG